MKHIFVRIVMIICFLFAAPLYAQDARVVGNLVAAGDAAFQRFDNQAAMESYQKGLEIDPQCYEATWKLARAYIDLGEKLTDKEQRKKYYLKAHELGITYEVLDNKDLAIKEYEKAMELPISDSDDEDHKAKAEESLKKLKP